MNRITFYLILSFLLLSPGSVYGITCNFSGSAREVIEINPEKNTGLDAIYVAYSTQDINKISISGISGTEIEVKRYSSLGGGYAEEIPFDRNGDEINILSPLGNMGYLISYNGASYSFWLVDYSKYPLNLEGVVLTSPQECEMTSLHVNGSGSDILYYTIDGRQKTLSREIKLRYSTLIWNEDQSLFEQSEMTKELESIEKNVVLIPPLYCQTRVKITGDRFLQEWHEEQNIESEAFQPTAVAVNSKAVQNEADTNENSNLLKNDQDGLGGSAPAEITFYGYVTDGVLHTEWQMASDQDFDNILYRFNEQDVTYTFTQDGEYYMRFIGSNADGSCESIGDTYSISIGASELKIPNAFSPNNDGVNDVWKVGYRSLLNFECWIFNSKGNEIYRFSDPSSGWDGTYRGKPVNPGVYYYVIRAEGADGVKYKKSGDINILNYKKIGESTGSVEE